MPFDPRDPRGREPPRGNALLKLFSWLTFLHVAKYHLGKVKLEQVGQLPSPTSVCDLRGGPRRIAGLLMCPFASVALHCSVAC